MEKIMTPQEVYAESIKNRKKFLAPYREKFEKAKDEKAKAKIISELIEIEPSHLSEPWIIKQVIAWLRDRDFADFIEDIFVKAPKRKVTTEKQKNKYMSDYFLIKHIDEIINDKGVSIREACRVLMNRIIHSDKRYHYSWDTENTKQKLDGEIILERYKYAKKKQNLQPKDYPPYPYFGRDIEDEENGKFTIFGGR